MPPTQSIHSNHDNHPPHIQEHQLFRAYSWYRVILASLLLVFAFSPAQMTSFGHYNPQLYLFTDLAYLILTIITLINGGLSYHSASQRKIFITIIIDICVAGILSFASGGVGSGLEIIPIVSIAAASIFFSGNTPTLVSAFSALSLLIMNAFFSWLDSKYISQFSPAGLTGALFFITSFSVQHLSKRIRSAQEFAHQKAADAANLQELNQMIVQRLRTGIIVCDQDAQIRVKNKSSTELLNTAPDHPNILPTQLLEQYRAWKANPLYRASPISTSTSGHEVQASFAKLSHRSNHNETLIFLEDTGRLAQKAQQLKLASLGRLTASIAHEIRNPLSAISHAAQLLKESDNLDKADIRLSDIIHNHCQRVNQIIENVLTLSRRQNSQPQRIQLSHWLKDFLRSLEESSPMAIDVQVTITPEDACVSFDPSQLTQVLTNLCQNGLRYSEKKTGKATLKLRGQIQAETQLPYLDIIDDGEGITPQFHERIFEPFFTTENNGTGLGLYLAKELCEANQARITYHRLPLESSLLGNYSETPEPRSCFRITFAHPDKNIGSQLIE